MTASRASSPAAGLLAAGLLSAGLFSAGLFRAAPAAAGPAELAQASGGPIEIVPLAPPPGTAASPGSAAPSAAPPAAAAPGPAAAPAGPENILPKAVEPTSAAPASGAPPSAAPETAESKSAAAETCCGSESEGAGVLGESDGGLGADLWRGTPRAVLAELIPAIPAAIPSPALHELARRLLLSTAKPPEGPRGSGPSLLMLRVRKLAEMGDFDGMRALAAVAKGAAAADELARISAEGRLLDDKTAALCQDVPALMRTHHDVFWQELQVFCQALAKNSQLVELGLGLLRDEGSEEDPAYFALIEALIGGKAAKVTSLAGATPLTLAVMRAAKLPLPEDGLDKASPAVLRAIAESPDAGVDVRLAAAERATLLGALPGAALRKVYDSVPVSDADLQNALSKAQSEYGPRARVLLYRGAKAQSVPTARAEAVRAALSLARAAGVYAIAVAVNLPFIEAMSPTPELGFFAGEAGRSLVFADEIDKAEGWFALADSDNRAGGVVPTAATSLWPYDRLIVSDSQPWDNERFGTWLTAERARVDGEAKLANERAARFLGLAAALGKPVTSAAWQPLYGAAEPEPAAMPSIALWHGLNEAAAAGRRGECLLLALAAVGSGGLQNTNPIAVEAVIDGLRQVGLDKEARRLAIEAAVAVGL